MRHHDRLGFASPPALLDFAHSAGILLQFEALMWGKALRKFAAQPQRGGLLLSPSFLCFELSERFDMTGEPALRGLMERMRAAGFRFALDDFGAGRAAGQGDAIGLDHTSADPENR